MLARRGASGPAGAGVDEPVFHLWPENVASYQLWLAVQTQWRVGGMGHPTGLDYASIRAKPAFRAVEPRNRREEALADVEAMEGAWLDERARQREIEASRQRAGPRGMSGDG